MAAGQIRAPGPAIQDGDGLVTYIVASSNKPPPELDELYNEVSPIREGLLNVVTSAVIVSSGADDKKKNDPATWSKPMQAMTKAFCAGYSESTQRLDELVVGVKTATKVINLLLEAVVNQGAALADFQKFLRSQGEAISLQTSSTTETYSFAACSIVHEIFEATDGRWIYVPKFKTYFTKFTRDTLSIATACASAKKVCLAFDLQIMTGAFMVDSWRTSQTFQTRAKDFINKFQKTNIEDSENCFKRIFSADR